MTGDDRIHIDALKDVREEFAAARTRFRYWEIAQEVCSAKELEAITLRDRHHCGTRLSAMMLGISRTSVKDRLASADKKIHDALNQPKETAA